MFKDVDVEKLGIIPSFVTVIGMMLGIHALCLVFQNQLEMACVCIILSAILDGLDGRLARYLQVTSKFGGILDSLSDFLNFGIATGFILFQAYAKVINSDFYFIFIMLYIVCCALRLARFSVIGMNGDNLFFGLPVVGSSFLILMPLIWQYAFALDAVMMCYISMGMMLFASIMMLTRVSMFSLSRLQIKKDYIAPILVCFSIAIRLLYIYQWALIALLQLIYLASVLLFMVKKNED